MAAGTGLGYFQNYATIGQALGWNGLAVTNVDNVNILLELVHQKLMALQHGAPIADDIRVFIKMEPHKLAKIESGTLRLIMVMSLEDQMVDRVLFGTWAEAERDFFSIPGKTGWVPIPYGYRYFNSVFAGSVLATDCSAFDWTFPEWVATSLLEMRLSMVRGPSDEYVAMATNRWAQVLRYAVIRLPTGERFQQRFWGLMKSGWYRTIAENSSAQVLINLLAWKRAGFAGELPTMWSMGDDVILDWSAEENVQEFERALSSTGILVKQSLRDREFGGFRFGTNTVTPLYHNKHDYALRFVPMTLRSDVATSFVLLYALADSSYTEVVRTHIEPHADISSLIAKQWACGSLKLDTLVTAFPSV